MNRLRVPPLTEREVSNFNILSSYIRLPDHLSWMKNYHGFHSHNLLGNLFNNPSGDNYSSSLQEPLRDYRRIVNYFFKNNMRWTTLPMCYKQTHCRILHTSVAKLHEQVRRPLVCLWIIEEIAVLDVLRINYRLILQKRSWVIFRCGLFFGMFLVLLFVIIVGCE